MILLNYSFLQCFFALAPPYPEYDMGRHGNLQFVCAFQSMFKFMTAIYLGRILLEQGAHFMSKVKSCMLN